MDSGMDEGSQYLCYVCSNLTGRLTTHHELHSTRAHTHGLHLDLSRCPLVHKSLQPPVLRTERVVIQPVSSGGMDSGN